jgi:Ring finger domain
MIHIDGYALMSALGAAPLILYLIFNLVRFCLLDQIDESTRVSEPHPSLTTAPGVDIETPPHAALSGRILKTASSDKTADDCVACEPEMPSSTHSPLVADFGESSVFTIQDDHTACTICLLEYEHGDHVQRSSTCNHIFHKRCITEWLKTGKSECPCCRSVFNSNLGSI